MVEQSSPLEVFCSYAPQDEVWLRKLIAHLKLLEREGLVLLWHDLKYSFQLSDILSWAVFTKAK